MTASIVEEFANNNTLFMEEFGPAFQIMIERGYRTGELVAAEPDSVTPSASPTGSSTSLSAIAIVIIAAIMFGQFATF
jgi:hypothetical protein